jgi:hypothetical protein
MRVTIELPADIEGRIVEQARALGLSLPDYLERVLRNQGPAGVPPTQPVLTPAERAAAWRQSVAGLPDTAPLSDAAISRETIYGERG